MTARVIVLAEERARRRTRFDPYPIHQWTAFWMMSAFWFWGL